MNNNPGEFMDVNQCAEYLKIQPTTIYKWISTSRRNKIPTIPFIKLYGRLIFRTTDVLQWVVQYKITSSQ